MVGQSIREGARDAERVGAPDIACKLSGADYRNRLAWIAEINASALRDYRREGQRIELSYDPSAAAQVQQLVDNERRCCPFLEFTIQTGKNAVMLVIEAPRDAADAADALFAPYREGGSPT